MNKIKQLKTLVDEIQKELCEKIGGRVINLVDEVCGEESKFSYWIGSEQYDVRNVVVNHWNGTHRIEDAFLHFEVDLVWVDTDGGIQYLDDTATLQDIPYEFAIQLLELVYDKVIGREE